jgi:hypothetical protein
MGKCGRFSYTARERDYQQRVELLEPGAEVEDGRKYVVVGKKTKNTLIIYLHHTAKICQTNHAVDK